MAACSAGALSDNNNPASNNCKLLQMSGSTTNQGQKPWQQRLLGKHLVRCDQSVKDKLPTSEVSQSSEVLGLYFSFVDPGASCDDFTRHLVDLYSNVNSSSSSSNGANDAASAAGCKKRLEVIHVLLWSNVQDVIDLDESFRNHVAELPWLAVPSDDYERKVREPHIHCCTSTTTHYIMLYTVCVCDAVWWRGVI